MSKILFKSIIITALIVSSLPAINCQAKRANIVTNPTTSPVENNILITIIVSGGRCVYGLCRSELNINSDGSYTTVENKKKNSGQITKDDLMELQQLIQSTNFNEIKSKPFTGTCPTAYDGSEITYIVKVDNANESISTCKYAVDPNLPLFTKLNKLRDEIRSNESINN